MSWLMSGYRLLWSGDVQVPDDYMGLVIQTWPNGHPSDSVPPSFDYSVYRVWDHRTADNKYLTWAAIETSPGVYDWTQLDAIMTPVKAAGKKVHWTIQSTPVFYAEVPLQGINDAYGYPGGASACTNLPALQAFLRALLRRYPGQIIRIGVRNEPDFATPNTFYRGTATQLAQEARAVWMAAKPLNAQIKILSPADWSSGTNGWLPFLAASDGAGGTGKDWIDAMAWHPYYRYWHTDKYLTTTFGYDVRTFHAAARANLAAAGMPPDFPIYCDEVGYASDRNYPDLLSSTTAELARWFTRLGIGWATLGIKGIYPYCYETVNSGNARDNPSVAIAWNNVARCVAGKRLRTVHHNPTTDLYRIETFEGEVFEI